MASTNDNGRVVAPAVLQPQLSTDVVGFNLENNQASTLGQQYITFQETFLPGDVTTGTDLVAIVNGQKIPVQMDVKTFNDDGSVRSALLTFQQPSIAADSSLSFMLSTTGTDFTTGALSLANLNGSNYDLKISIALQGGSTVVLDAATLLQQALNAGTVSYWQSGPLATQGRVDIPIAGSLHVTLDITRYADGSTSTDVQFNNDYAMQSVGGTAVYNVTIQQNGSTVLQQNNITEYQYQTWHTVVSSTGTAQANVVQDIDYLQHTGAIPNLDLAAGVDSSSLSAEIITGNQILGPGSVTQNMPMTGGRADIGLMPSWDAIWLITQDAQAAKYALAQADAAGSVPWHYFDPKTGTYLSLGDYPTLWADPRGTPTLTQQPSGSSGWTPEAAHQPDLSYVAYLLTGDRYYLDQLNAQATFAEFTAWNVPRENGLGLVANGSDQVRQQAWSLRVIDEAAWANPTGSAEQTYFTKLAANNWSWLVSQIPVWTQQEGQAYGYVPGTYGDGSGSTMAPWQQDYFASVAIEAAQMGNADALTFLKWEANFLVGQFLNSSNGFNPHDGAAYNLIVGNGNGTTYQTWAQIEQATVAAGDSNGSGWADGNFAELAAQTLAGIITLTGSSAAKQAYDWLMSSGAPQINPFVDPQFDVVPDQPVNTGSATLSIVAVNGTQSEGTTGATTPFTFTVTRGGNTSIASSASWAVTGSGANAAAGSDFAGGVLPSGTVSFAAAETSKTITVNVAGDTVVEPDEGFTVTLSNPAASTTIGTASASGTIRNDDGGQASLSIAALSADKVEGQSGSSPFTFTVTRGGNTSIASSASWAVTGSGANAAAGSDFAGGVLPSGTVSFAAAETSKTITVNVAGDTVVEPDEGFTVTLSNPAASTTIGTASASGTIRNDDGGQASLSIAALSADKVEGQSGSSPFTFTVTRGGNTSIASSASWAVTGSGANAAAGSDFAGGVLPSGTVSFAAAETSKTITVNVAGDTVVEPDEGFTVTLSNPSNGATIVTAAASGTIRNDDVPTTTIEAFGVTRLVKVGNQFQLMDASNSGPTVKYQGGAVTAGQFGAWTPLGAEKVGTGYQVVWQNGSADQYLFWNTDSNGNWKSGSDPVSGSSYALQSLETTFQQDFNHDGTTGLKTTPIETAGATDLDQVANAFFLHDSAGNGPSLKYAGADVVAGQFGAWTPLGAEKVGTGYQVVWQNGSADQYLFWNTDSNGNWKSESDPVSGSSYALQSLETTFQQDFNHDGTTGLKTTPIETAGATDLDQVANAFFLHDSAGNGPSLKYAGADVVAGQFGAWTPLGAEKVGTGYQVVWQNGSADQYLFWNTDSNGNWKSGSDPVSGSSYALQSLETTFQQDFNHDGTTGLKTTPIETAGATDLDQVANAFFLHDSAGNGPSLKYAGADVVAGQFGAWTPLGAEKVGTGYQVVWQNGSADQYLFWNTDSNGNWKSESDPVSGSSYALQSLETTFQQDFNHDGTTGLKTTPIETVGATDLDQVANAFFLHDSAGNGPSLKYAGADVVAGQFGAWTPLGAEKVGTGYQVVWQNGSADQFLFWNTDSNGNWKSQSDLVSGSSYALQSLETTFQQDFNHDGTTGLKTTPIETAGATHLDQVANEFFLRNAAGSGPSIKYAGSDVVAGQFGAWTPLGAEKTANGYEVAWQNGTANQYVIWDVDNNGNWKSQSDLVSGSSPALKAVETILHQDLNHDTIIG